MSANPRPVRQCMLDDFISDLPNLTLNKTVTLHSSFVFLSNQDTVCISKAVQGTDAICRPVPIKVGEQLHWIGKWKIELSPLSGTTVSNRQYFVRPYNNKKDALLLRYGVRVVRGSKLPPIKTRVALPVVTDEEGKVVAIPHFKYNNRIYGIKVTVHYHPLISLDHACKCNSMPASNC